MICSNNEKKQVELWLSRLDGSGSDEEWNAVFKLRQTLADDFPKYLLSSYLSSTKWRERSSFVYHATRYARHTPEALNLGVNALTDKV